MDLAGGEMLDLDQGHFDEKIIAVYLYDPGFSSYDFISKIPQYDLRELETFFSDYKQLEGKPAEVGNALASSWLRK